ncbi:hypothetical protein K3722_00490 [Leisingera caerulea]|uniref:Uncharacterized protein n=1 Tax=Leisingera caerulea TaxID=506591 RepID=A0ABY5WWV2_LEICA|nr:hypothetical protein [Leisingera caerulea]UWQ58646.1 hypothetical protein K3722_00490 [Leisingera caerulea]
MSDTQKTIGEIAGKNFETRSDFEEAMGKMKAYSDAELLYEVAQKHFSRGYRNELQAIALAEAEVARRSQVAAESLAFRTTKWAAGLGIVGALTGAVLGALVTYLLSN